MSESVKFAECFGHAISETDEIRNADDIINKFSAKEKCVRCTENYNCLSLACMQAGYGNDQTIERFLQSLKFYSLISQQFGNLKSLPMPLTEHSLEKMQETTQSFIEELKKKENQKLRETLIEQMTTQYKFLMATADAMKDFLEALGENTGGFEC